MKAEKEKVSQLLRTAKGQLEGILRMVEEDRYCIDISNQIMATNAILRKINNEILHAHMYSCVQQAFAEGNADAKIEELMGVIQKLSK